MLEFLRRSSPPSDLIGIVRYVRARWRAKLAVKGAVRVIAISVAIFFALAYGMQWARFSAPSILASRFLLGAGLLASIYFFLVRPLRRQVTDEQVALYLEEKEPSLQTMLVSAMCSTVEKRNRPKATPNPRRVRFIRSECFADILVPLPSSKYIALVTSSPSNRGTTIAL